MEETHFIGLAAIIILGIGAQWLAWRIRLPSILLLLVAGFVAGPLTGFLHPDELLGDLLFPFISLSVGLILFEGGMSLKLHELREIGSTVRNLILVGSVVTWAVGALAAHYIVGLDFQLSLLLGAILIVTGPTVITPLLRQVRPTATVASILKWEGILIDPVGATLALLVFEWILASQGVGEEATPVGIAILKTIVAGGAFGFVGAMLIAQMLKRFWIPDFLQSPVTLMVAVAALTASNLIQEESGLLAVTVMGVVLANQKSAEVGHILEFKENLRVILISALFILLAARLRVEDITGLPLRSVGFVLVLIVVARPAAIFVSTAFSKLAWNERAFLAWLAPRGIVAAAVSSVFALRLTEAPVAMAGAETLAPLTFLVIVSTVGLYGLTASPVARRLGVAQPDPQGLLICGAHPWARMLAVELKKENIAVVLADSNWSNISAARMDGLKTYYGNILSEDADREIDLTGIGHLVALTANDGINALATLHFSELFGRGKVYQLPSDEGDKAPGKAVARTLQGRELFGTGNRYWKISGWVVEGAIVKKTPLGEEFDYEKFKEHYAENAIPLLLIDEHRKIRMFTTNDPPKPQPGHLLISLVRELDGRSVLAGEPT